MGAWRALSTIAACRERNEAAPRQLTVARQISLEICGVRIAACRNWFLRKLAGWINGSMVTFEWRTTYFIALFPVRRILLPACLRGFCVLPVVAFQPLRPPPPLRCFGAPCFTWGARFFSFFLFFIIYF